MLSQAIASVRPKVFRHFEKLDVDGTVSKRADKPNPRGRKKSIGAGSNLRSRGEMTLLRSLLDSTHPKVRRVLRLGVNRR
jgi:hypothetical protein